MIAKHLAHALPMSYLLKTQLQLQKLLCSERCLAGIFTCQKRLLYKNIKIFDHTCEITTYNDYRINYKPIVNIVMQTLKEILNTSTYETNRILAIYPQFKNRSRVNILNNYYNLIEAGVQKSAIKKNIWLLVHDDIKLKEKLDCISTLNMSNEELVPWLRLTQDKLVNNINYIQADPIPYTYNKIEYLAYRLECSIEELCKLTVQYPFILKMPIPYVDKKLNVLHEYDVNNKNILKNLWVLRYSESHIRHKCKLYKNTRNAEMQTWAIRPLQVVTRVIQENDVEHDLLQNVNDIDQYLLNKLNIKKEYLQNFITKWPNILQINLRKLDKIITILHKNGITNNEIMQNGIQIFFFSQNTIQKRVQILNEGNILVTIPVLKLSNKLFERYIQKDYTSKKRNRMMQYYENNKKYLICKLNVNKKAIAKFLKRWPYIIKVDILKLEEMLNMLYQYGFTNNEIITHGQILHYNTKTLRKRIETLKEAGIAPKITVIMFNKKDFEHFMRLHTKRFYFILTTHNQQAFHTDAQRRGAVHN